MKITVLIPTFRRPDDLRRCLAALAKQARPADEVRVVVRDGDDETPLVLREFEDGVLPLVVSNVAMTGVVAAMSAGLRDASGDVIAITDDDAAPWPDWLARIEAGFIAHPTAAGVGGRDWVYRGELLEDGARHEAGVVRWYGKVVGQHHVAVGPGRSVDVLKGVNCAYRAAPLREIGFDARLLGTGAQTHWELSLGLALKRNGWSLWFDPAIAVDHGRGKRHDEDQRDSFNALALSNDAHNETLVLLGHLSPARRAALLVWAMAIGTHPAPGAIQVLRLLARRDRHVFRRWWAALRGRALAVRMHMGTRSAGAATSVSGPLSPVLGGEG